MALGVRHPKLQMWATPRAITQLKTRYRRRDARDCVSSAFLAESGRKCGREVYGAGFLIQRTPDLATGTGFRGFESHHFRQTWGGLRTAPFLSDHILCREGRSVKSFLALNWIPIGFYTLCCAMVCCHGREQAGPSPASADHARLSARFDRNRGLRIKPYGCRSDADRRRGEKGSGGEDHRSSAQQPWSGD